MFGVLVVENANKEIGYLCAFSGKFINKDQPSFFVPALFDISTKNSFLGKGMTELSEIGSEIKTLESEINSNKDPRTYSQAYKTNIYLFFKLYTPAQLSDGGTCVYDCMRFSITS